MSFFERLKLAFSIIFGAKPVETPAPPPTLPAPMPSQPVVPSVAPTTPHASALHLLGLLQREGRLLDFLKEDITGFADADVGAAARLVHAGCKKVIDEYLAVAPVRKETEGASIEVQAGYDANRVRLTGNVTGQGPWRGALKHHGWAVQKVTLPQVPPTIDVNVLAPAEVELP